MSATMEQALLGGLMLDPSAWDRVCDLVSEADFAEAGHRIIWRALADMAERGDQGDPLALADRLRVSGQLERLRGGAGYLSELYATTPSARNVQHYARRIREQSILRQVVGICRETAEVAESGECEPGDLLDRATTQLGMVAEQAQRGGGMRDARAIMQSTVSYLESVVERQGELLGLSTGLADVDAITAGLQPTDLIILAARPSMGKTSMAMGIAEHAARTATVPVVVFSLEMSSEQLGLRLVASRSGVDFGRLRRGALEDREWPMVTQAMQQMRDARLLIDDAPGLTIGDIMTRARRVHREHGGLALVVVDYLQLITTRERSENRNIEIAKVSAGLKAMAKSLKVPVLALSQLNRSVEQRTNKRPIMSDLRDSGSIEQDADVIAFLYRDEVYHPDSQDKGVAELIIGKQRNGETGTVALAWQGAQCRFADLAKGYRRADPGEGHARRGGRDAWEY